MYKLIKKNSPNRGYPDGAKGGNAPKKIIIHHWGVKGQKFENVTGWLCNPNAGVSAHYVLQAKKVAKLMGIYDCAWHAGSYYWNSHSIGIECRPECTKEDRATLVELIADLYDKYGFMPLIGHKDVAATACPGDWYKWLPKIQKSAKSMWQKRKKEKGTYPGVLPVLPERGYFDKNDSGVNVKRLQGFLNWSIAANLEKDSIVGPATIKAVRTFQKKCNLEADGLFGEDCLAKARKVKK